MKCFRYNLFLLLSVPLAFALSLVIDMNWLLGSSKKPTRLNAVDKSKFEVVEEYINRDDWVIAYGPFGETDLNLYYENKLQLQQYIREAEVVFLGNSRSQFAYNRLLTEDFFQQHDVRFHHLGFGCSERISIELSLLKKKQARPKVFILNVDNNFFDKHPSPCAARLLAGDDFGYRRLFQSRFLQKMMFYINDVLVKLNSEYIYLPDNTLYRQIYNGLWVTDAFSHSSRSHHLKQTKSKSCKPLSEHEKKMINNWMNQIKKISPDSLIINTYVPRPGFCERRLQEISEYMNVPYFQVENPNELTVFDGSHLSVESAELFTQEFTEFFETNVLPVLKSVKD